MCVTIVITKLKLTELKGGEMGIMVSKDLEQKSELNRRISSDLRARTASAEALRDPDYDDEVDTEGTKRTGKFTWVWIVLIVLAIISLFCILFI